MAHKVCPWWLGYLLINPLRRLLQDPRALLGPFVQKGMTVLEPGCGMGFFTLELARLVGPSGRVVAVDVQPKMLAGLRRRARKAGLQERIQARQAKAGELGAGDLAGEVDFALAFAMVHEVPDAGRFFAELHASLRPGRKLLVAEPRGHVTAQDFAATIAAAERAGFCIEGRPSIRSSHAVVLAATPAAAR